MNDKSMDRAVIMARGLGTRMREEAAGTLLNRAEERVAATGVKAQMPRPPLAHLVDKAGAVSTLVAFSPRVVDGLLLLATSEARLRVQVSYNSFVGAVYELTHPHHRTVAKGIKPYSGR